MLLFSKGGHYGSESHPSMTCRMLSGTLSRRMGVGCQKHDGTSGTPGAPQLSPFSTELPLLGYMYIYIYGTIYTVFRPTHFLYFLFVLNGKTPYQAWCKNCHDCSASEDLYKDGAAPTSQDLWSLSLTFVFLKVGDLLSLLHGRWQLRVTNVLIHLWMLEDYTGTSFKKPL